MYKSKQTSGLLKFSRNVQQIDCARRNFHWHVRQRNCALRELVRNEVAHAMDILGDNLCGIAFPHQHKGFLRCKALAWGKVRLWYKVHCGSTEALGGMVYRGYIWLV